MPFTLIPINRHSWQWCACEEGAPFGYYRYFNVSYVLNAGKSLVFLVHLSLPRWILWTAPSPHQKRLCNTVLNSGLGHNQDQITYKMSSFFLQLLKYCNFYQWTPPTMICGVLFCWRSDYSEFRLLNWLDVREGHPSSRKSSVESKGSIQITSSAPTFQSSVATSLQDLGHGRHLRMCSDTNARVQKASCLEPPAALDLSSKAFSVSTSGKSTNRVVCDEAGFRQGSLFFVITVEAFF